jgi:Zn-dependent M28 family amino/carboxypeptidase
MNRFYSIVTAILVFSTGIHAQEAVEKGVNAITEQGIEAHLAFLADDILEGREAGKRGGALAAGYIKAVLSELGIAPFVNGYYQPFEAYGRDRQKKASFQVHPDSIARYQLESGHRRLYLKNVIGYIEGRRKDQYVILGAHYDHLGTDELLAGDRIYNGADDNASGVAAALQIAHACVATGEKPERSIIFAFWDAEELGCLGSEYFAANFESLAAIKGYINLDMLGRDGTLPFPAKKETPEVIPNAFFFLYANELAKYSEQLNGDIDAYRLNITANVRVLSAKARGSDNASFSGRNIPVLWFFSGIHPDYHTPGDEIDKINFNKLTGLTKIVYLNLWKLANEY